ncbi:MAG TPA: methyltransferase domain-containing protein [Candidatus Rifleibacterium sp.]|nr:methyltransferase domain-containing protein [Candidatus Rifleibacterium sp.]
MSETNRDRIFAEIIEKPADFVFDDRVAAVFPDMLKRSIPGYPAIINMIETLTARYAQPGSNLYDLGCSLGASSLAMLKGLKVKNCLIVGIDTSNAMIDRCRQIASRPEDPARMEFICADANSCEFNNASVVVMNFTLQKS